MKMKKITKLVLSLLMMLTCINLVNVHAEGNEDNTDQVSEISEDNSTNSSKTLQLTGTNNSWEWCDYNQTWSSSDESIATVVKDYSDSSKATVTGLKPGTVTISHIYCSSGSWVLHNHKEVTETFIINVTEDSIYESIKAYVYVNGSGYSDEALEVLGISKDTLDKNRYFPVGEITLNASYLNGKDNKTTAGSPLINRKADWSNLVSSLSNMNTQTLTEDYAANKGNHVADYLSQATGDINKGWGSGKTALFYWPNDGRTSYGFDDQSVRYHLDLHFNTSVINYVTGNNGITDGSAKDGTTVDTRTYISGSTAIAPRNLNIPDGYKLVGYYTDRAMTHPWVPGETIVNEGATVYIKIAKMVDVVINYIVANETGGTVSLDSEHFNPRTGTVTGSTASASEGYYFDGWYSDEQCTTKVSPDLNYRPSAPEGGWQENTSFTYYAKFIPLKSVTVNYYWNGTDIKLSESKVISDKKVGEQVVEAPTTIDGYTAVSNKSQTIIVSDDGGTIDFYYYKNVTLTANSSTNEYKYDGSQKSVSGYTCSETLVSNDVVATVSDFGGEEVSTYPTFDGVTAGATGTDADTYIATFSEASTGKVDTTSKYIVTNTVNGSLVISPRSVTLTSATDSKEYDGTPLTNANVTVGGDGFAEGEGATYSVTGSQTLKGTSENTFDYTLNDGTKSKNYTITKEKGSLSVSDRTDKFVVNVKANNTTVTYDGNSHEATGVETYEFTVNDQKFTVSGLTTENPKATDAGTYTNNISGVPIVRDTNGNDVTDQFTVNTENGNLVINKRNVVLTAASAEKVYDGTPLTATEVTVEGDGFVEGEVSNLTATGTITNVGSVVNGISYTYGENYKSGNYNVTKNNGTLTVTAKSITPETPEGDKTGITSKDPDDVKYNGASQQQRPEINDTKTSKTLVEGTDYEVTYSEDTTNAGQVTVTITGIGNYTGEYTVTYNILKRDVTFTSPSASKTYDGSALTSTEIAISGEGFVEGEGASFNVTGTATEVGEVDNTFDYAMNEGTNADNYNVTVVNGKLTITAAPVVPSNDDTTPTTPVVPATTPTRRTTPVTPAQPEVTPTETPEATVEPTATPEATATPEVIDDDETPEVAPKGNWALINLIAAMLSVLLGVIAILAKHKDEDEDEEDETEDENVSTRHRRWKIVSAIDAIVAVVAFILTEDITQKMVMVDKWTILMVVIAVVGVVSMYFTRKWQKEDEETSEDA